MLNDANWLLPEGVEEILPDQANKLESLRRTVLDGMQDRGFSLVMPPVMEFVDSLLTGTGEELDTQTYKFMDQQTHRMLGIRADMTPQIARIDAHYLADNEINRLCYAGTVLRTQPSQMGGARELLQAGAELFGVADESADIDIIETMLQVLESSRIGRTTLSLGHVGLYRALKQQQHIGSDLEPVLFDILLRKSFPDLDLLSVTGSASKHDFGVFKTLMSLQGDEQVITQASSLLPNIPEIDKALSQLATVVDHLKTNFPTLNIHLDLADVFGYRYHTGLKFSAFVDGEGRAIAKGGRYDRIGEQFGRARPATGFSVDLKALIKLQK